MSIIDITKCLICSNSAFLTNYNASSHYYCYCCCTFNNNNYNNNYFYYEIYFYNNEVYSFYFPLKQNKSVAIGFINNILSLNKVHENNIIINNNCSFKVNELTTKWLELITQKYLILNILD